MGKWLKYWTCHPKVAGSRPAIARLSMLAPSIPETVYCN